MWQITDALVDEVIPDEATVRDRTRLTVFSSKADVNDRMFMSIMTGHPLHTPTSIRAGCGLCRPINNKMGGVETLSRLCLPTMILRHRSKQINSIVFSTAD